MRDVGSVGRDRPGQIQALLGAGAEVTSGRPVTPVARDLGIHKEALRGWVRQAEADQAGPTC